MGIVLGVGRLVKKTMMSRPPERAFLQGAAPQTCQAELKDPARLVGLVREVAMVTTRHAKHADEVQERAQDDVHRMDARAKDGEASRVDGEKGDALQPGRLQADL